MGQASLTRDQLEVLLEIHDPDYWDEDTAVWDTAIWDGSLLTPSDSYLSGTVGTVSTPDTADLSVDGGARWTFDLLMPTDVTAYQTLVVHGWDPNRAWQFFVQSGKLSVLAQSGGTTYYFDALSVAETTPTIGKRILYRLEMRLASPYMRVTSAVSFDNGMTWTVYPERSWSTMSGLADGIGPLASGGFKGSIYSLQYQAINRARLVFPGVAGNHVSVPNAANLNITGDFEIAIRMSATDWTPAANGAIASKTVGSGNRSWYLMLAAGGAITFNMSPDGTNSASTSATAPGFTDGSMQWLKVTRVMSSGLVSFYSAADSAAEPTTWTARGTGTLYAGQLISSSTTAIWLGEQANSTSPMTGRIARVIVRDAIGAVQPQFIFPGTTGNYLSVPDAANLDVIGDIEIVARLTPTTWRPPRSWEIVNKYATTGNQRSYRLILTATGNPSFFTSSDGTTGQQATATAAIPNDGAPRWLKVTRSQSTGNVTFFYAADSSTEPGTWTQLGAIVTATIGNIFAGTAPVWIGSASFTTTDHYTGRVARVIVRNGIGGTTVLDINESNATTPGQTSFTATTGQTVTVTQTTGNTIVRGTVLDINENNASRMTGSTFTATTGQTVTVNQTAGNAIVQPQLDKLVWRFDAREYKSGTSFTDPRGRTWTLSTMGAITVGTPDPIPPSNWSDEPGWVNATCDVRGFVLERGRQQNWDSMLAANAQIELDNSHGKYSVYGSQSYPRIRPGLDCAIYATWDNVRYPLFIGYVSEYSEGQVPNDYKVTLKAFDNFRLLADQISGEYNPGVSEEQCGDRIHALLNRISYTGLRQISQGSSTMTNYLTSRTILDEIQVTAMSDGGIFFQDNDGTLVYLGQERIYGRSHGGTLPRFSDACDDSGLPYAAIEPIMADNEFANVITISNVSQGTDSPFSAMAVDTQSIVDNGRFYWTTEQLAICNAEYVQQLADFQLSRRSQAFYRINSFECYPVHDDRIWPTLLGMRIGDAMLVQRTPPESNAIQAPMLCDGIRIEATPALWKFTIRCSPGDKVDLANFWDFDMWDDGTWV